jgi:hypothetical protein
VAVCQKKTKGGEQTVGDDRESVAQMVSEFAREVAVLILVFVPLDYLLKSDQIQPHAWLGYGGVVTVSLCLLTLGISIERGVNLPWSHKMQLLAAIWIPAAVAVLVGIIGLYFAKRERDEAQRRLELTRPQPNVPDESSERTRDFLPHRPKPSPS